MSWCSLMRETGTAETNQPIHDGITITKHLKRINITHMLRPAHHIYHAAIILHPRDAKLIKNMSETDIGGTE
jgi:hypothetical protein